MSAPQNVHVNPLYLGTYLAARVPMAMAAEQPAASKPFLKETDQPLSPPRTEGSIQIADAAPPVEGEALASEAGPVGWEVPALPGHVVSPERMSDPAVWAQVAINARSVARTGDDVGMVTVGADGR